MTLALITRLARLSYEADAEDALRLMTDAEFEEWVAGELGILSPMQLLSDALDYVSIQDKLLLDLVVSPVASTLPATILRTALRRMCARDCASRADGYRIVQGLQDELTAGRDHFDAIGADRRAMARESRS
jgi:hypothetical protein